MNSSFQTSALAAPSLESTSVPAAFATWLSLSKSSKAPVFTLSVRSELFQFAKTVSKPHCYFYPLQYRGSHFRREMPKTQETANDFDQMKLYNFVITIARSHIDCVRCTYYLVDRPSPCHLCFSMRLVSLPFLRLIYACLRSNEQIN